MAHASWAAGSLAATALLCVALPDRAAAGAFQLNERSAGALGAALSGSVSAASDVTFATFNPAALSKVESIEIGGNASGVFPRTDGEFVSGPAAGYSFESSQSAFVPGSAAGLRISDDVVVGLLSYAPFGLVTTHPNDFPGAADATTSRLFTVQISPAVSWQPFDRLAIGATADILYSDVTLNSAVLSLDGDGVEVGFSAGLLWEPVDGTQIGAAYHSGFDLNVEGRQENAFFGGLEVPLQSRGSLPSVVQVGVTQSVTEDLRVMAEGRWIGWSAFDTLEFQSPALAGTPFAEFEEEQNYDDSFFIAIGTEYDVNERLRLRGGLAYDDTPTNDEFRTVRVPDGSRVWFAAGASYDVTEHMTVDFAYNYLRVFETSDVTLRNGALAGSGLEYTGDVHIVSVGGSLRF